MTLSELWYSTQAILPEVILALMICVVIVADMFVRLERSRVVCSALGLLGTALALGALWITPEIGARFFEGSVAFDNFTVLFKLLLLSGTLITMVFILTSRETAGYRHGEQVALVMGATLGGCLLAAAQDFIIFILALETLSLCSYVLAGAIKHERPSAEASLKYLLFGAVASGVMLFGLSYAYGLSGSIQIGEALGAVGRLITSTDPMLTIAGVFTLLLILAGLGFKIAMAPFQFWAPDVYQGAPTPITAFLSVVSKAAGFAALIRMVLPLLEGMMLSSISPTLDMNFVTLLMGILAVVTMTFGNLVALRQTDAKRLLAYSSIAHAGYLLLGLTLMPGQAGVEAIVFYFFIYLFMNLGAFWVVAVIVNRRGTAELEGFRGVAQEAPALCVAMFIFLISLTGLPPTAGFVAKFILFKAVVGAGVANLDQGIITATSSFYFTLAVVGVLNSALSLFYYMKIARAMVFDAPDPGRAPLGAAKWQSGFAVALAIPLLLLLNFGPLERLVSNLFETAPVLVSWMQ